MRLSHAIGAALFAVAAAMAPQSSAAESMADAATVAAGDTLPFSSLPDQHGKAVAIDAAVARILFTRDMDGGGLVKDVLSEGGAERLAAARAVYVSDVSGMPGFVLRTFALPSIRKRPYPVLVDESGETTRAVPSQEGKATVLQIDAGRITAITFAGSTAEVSAALAP